MIDIGEKVGDSTRTVLLAEDFGLPLRYYGRLDGAPWPEALAETADVAAVEQHLAALEGTRDYFIVTNAQLFARLSNLRTTLDRTYPVLARTESYVIYDLRRRSESGPSG